jgi:hypothetical protein
VKINLTENTETADFLTGQVGVLTMLVKAINRIPELQEGNQSLRQVIYDQIDKIAI